jgi:hypothetical protein
MAAIEKNSTSVRTRADWQELDKEHHLHPFTEHKVRLNRFYVVLLGSVN